MLVDQMPDTSRAADTVETDTLGFLVVEDLYCVTVKDRDDFAGEGEDRGWTEENEQKQEEDVSLHEE